MNTQRAACAAVTIAIALCGCQHIPPETIAYQNIADDVATRDIDIEPVHRFAESLLSSDGGEGAPFDVSDGISLREAKAIALWYNADVRMARLEAEGAESIADASGRWPDPEVGASYGRKREESGDTQTITIEDPNQTVSFTEEAGGIERTWVNAQSLSITIPLSGRYRAEKKLRIAQHGTAVLTALETEWRTLRDLEAAWYRWSEIHARIDLLSAHINDLESIARSATALANAGELQPHLARMARIALARHNADRDRLSYELQSQRAGILASMGLDVDADIPLIPTLGTSIPQPESNISENHPTIARVLSQYEIAERALRVELRKQYPDITITPSYSDENSETAFVVGMGLPIPVWNRNIEGIAEAVAMRDKARLHAERVYQDVTLDLRQHKLMLAGATAQYDGLTTNAADEADRQITEIEALFSVGEININMIHETMEQVLETKFDILQATLHRNIAATHIRAAVNPQAILPQEPTP